MPLMYRMPTAFGNMPGPRSDLKGQRFDWAAARRTVLRWQWAVDEVKLVSLLGPRCELLGAPRIQFEFQQLENLPWLAGRGYTLFSIKAPVTFRGRASDRKASLLFIMWENLAEPIISGREELGYPKLFADLEWARDDQAITGATAAWGGFQFFEAQVSRPAVPLKAPDPLPGDLLHNRYVPSVGDWGKALIDQYTCSPAPATVPVPASQEEVTVTAKFLPANWEDLPTLWHIVLELRELADPGPASGSLLTFKGGSDHYLQHVVE